MNRVLKKRIIREFKNNSIRYVALFFLVVMGMYMVVSMVGSADAIIVGSNNVMIENNVEDGNFTTFIPLTDNQLDNIKEYSNVTIDANFNYEVLMSDQSTLRLFKVRGTINKISLDKGCLPNGAKQIVVEKRYCDEHEYEIGDVIDILGDEFVICGIGSVPDYNLPVKTLADSAADSYNFGIGFVDEYEYDRLKKSSKIKAEEYNYSYRISNSITDKELKEQIKKLEFDYKKVKDKFFIDYIDEQLEVKNNIEENMNNLLEGAKNLNKSMVDLDNIGNGLETSSQEIFQEYLKDANLTLKELNYSKELTKENYSKVLEDCISTKYSQELIYLNKKLTNLDGFAVDTKNYMNGVSEVTEGSENLLNAISEFKDVSNEFIDKDYHSEIEILNTFVEAEKNPRINAAAQDVEMNKNIGLLAGLIVMILFTYVISVFISHQIQGESSIIGTLYAMGANKSTLLIHYMTLPIIIIFLASIVGTILGFSKIGVVYQMKSTYDYYSLPYVIKIYPMYLLIYCIVMPLSVCVCVTYMTINRKLSCTALSLIKNEQKEFNINNISLTKMDFIRKYQIRQMLRELKTGITVFVGLFIALIIFMVGVECYINCQYIKEWNVKDTKYEYMYNIKYPSNEVPKGGEACYIETLEKTDLGFTLKVNVMGIDDDNKYFEIKTVNEMNKIIIGSGLSKKYDLKVGDLLTLTDSVNNKNYVFEIFGINEYSIGLTAFMNIESMRELFGQTDQYYNTILSDSELDIPSSILYSSNTKNDIKHSADIFINKMMSLIVMLVGASIIIFCMVMFLMLNVMIDRASFGISLIKILGFRNKEIRHIYLDGIFILVMISSIISIPIAKLIVDTIYPSLVVNISCGTFTDMSLVWYMGIFVGIMIIYVVISNILKYKLNQISTNEVLKNRE